jgi:hypothetical protein
MGSGAARFCLLAAACGAFGCDLSFDGLNGQPDALMLVARPPDARSPGGTDGGGGQGGGPTHDRRDAGAEPDGGPPVSPVVEEPDAATAPDSGEPPDAVAADDRPFDPERLKLCPRISDLALCLRFEGEAIDESSRLHPLAVENVAFEAGLSRLAGSFGPPGGIEVPESAALDSARVTIEAWINPRTLPAAGTQSGVIDNNGQYGMFLRPDGNVVCIGRGIVTAVGAVAPGVWHSVACTFDETALSIYVDGVRQSQVLSLGPLLGAGTTGTSIGRDNPEGGSYDGLLDNVRIWRTIRTPQQLCGSAIKCPAGP